MKKERDKKMDVPYTSTLKVGDKTYIWNGDICYPDYVQSIDIRVITTAILGRFGRKTGKACGLSAKDPKTRHMYIANAAGERIVTIEEKKG